MGQEPLLSRYLFHLLLCLKLYYYKAIQTMPLVDLIGSLIQQLQMVLQKAVHILVTGLLLGFNNL